MADILVIDDQDRTVELCRRVMPEHTWHGPAHAWAEAHELLARLRRRVDLVLLDIHFDIEASRLLGLPANPSTRDVERARRRQGMEIFAALRQSAPELPVILMTARRDLPLERDADRHDAEEYTYFLDDEDVDARSLRAQVQGILAARRGTESDGAVYWGRSLVMRRIRQRLITLARGRLPVILAGPTGTGKSLIARHFIHARSGRKGRFIAVDLSTIPRDLVGAHLFGAVRGAYTGSVADRRGAFEEADGGTLFLDEIGHLSEDVQRMLLTVLQEGVVVRIGDARERQVDVKLIVASNEDLGELVRAGRFRADLYMRLNPACTVALPPLRERSMDLERLLRFTVARIAADRYVQELLAEVRPPARPDVPVEIRVALDEDLPDPSPNTVVLLFPERTMEALRRHRWPGNLREFTMALENAVTLTLAESVGAGRSPGAEARADIVQVRPKLVRDLLLAGRVTEDEVPSEGGWSVEVRVRPHESLNKVALDVERQYFTRLYLQEHGDFSAMSQVLLGDPTGGRRVQLRFNQLGLKVKDLRDQAG